MSGFVDRRRSAEERDRALGIIESSYDIGREVARGRIKAHEKHGENSIEAVPATDFGKWLAILGEEFGETCSALTYDKSTTMGELMANLRAELIDVSTVSAAWIAAIDQWMEPNGEEVEG